MRAIFWIKAEHKSSYELIEYDLDKKTGEKSVWGRPIQVHYQQWCDVEITLGFIKTFRPDKEHWPFTTGIDYWTKEKPCAITWRLKPKDNKKYVSWAKVISLYMTKEEADKEIIVLKNWWETRMRNYDFKFKIVEYHR